MNPSQPTTKRKIHTVSQLTAIIKNVLEDALPYVWITGEISNLRRPSSGHYYFTLKDEKAQMRGVMFKGHARNLKFMPEDGISVVCLGRIAVYEPQGAYQVLVEHMEPGGVGALALAFEQLKSRLSEEGLFDEEHKKEIPFIPKTIAVITSPTGAVIHDILRVLGYRYPNVHVQVWPVKVQGTGSAEQIVQAFGQINVQDHAELIILARGGGSLEDLASFNSEDVARAIFSSDIPVVSAVGHETDYTIADFVADKRAPTPSAAAEMAVPEYEGLQLWVKELSSRLKNNMLSKILYEKDRLELFRRRLPPPRRQIDDWRLRLDDHQQRIVSMMHRCVTDNRSRLDTTNYKINSLSPLKIIPKYKVSLELMSGKIQAHMGQKINQERARLNQSQASLEALNPEAILDRGYSITRKLPQGEILRNASAVSPGDSVEVTLASGTIKATVDSTTKGKK